MTDFVADATAWVVVTSTSETQLLQVDDGLRFTSMQTCVVFADETAAIQYAIKYGWSPPPEPLQ